MSLLARRAGVRIFRFFARALDPAGGLAGRPDLRVVGGPELERASTNPQLDLQPGKVAQAFARGDLCVGAFDGGELAGYCWFAFAPLPLLDGVWVDFGPDVVWVYKSLVRPSHRGRGLAPALYAFADSLGLQRGRRRSIICVETHNKPSIAAAFRARHGAAGYAAYARRAGGLSTWYSADARGAALRFFLPE